MKKFFNRRGNKGFTVVELVVVCLVIAILVAVAIPTYREVREEARQTAHDANVSELRMVAEIYVMKYPSQAAIWAPFANQKAVEEPTAVHDLWSLWLDKWPENPLEVDGTYVVEISEDGRVSISPEAGYYANE